VPATKITPKNQPARWITRAPDGTIEHDGETSVGSTTISGRELIHGEDEAAFLEAVSAIVPGGYNPLPAMGEPIEAGKIYSHNGEFVIARQGHTRTEHAPADVPALFATHRPGQGALEWVENEPVTIGTIRVRDGTEYRCIQTHQTQTGWEPENAPALWELIPNDPVAGEWASGAAYAVDDVVTYGGTDYRCLQSHTAQVGWEPPNVPALWAGA